MAIGITLPKVCIALGLEQPHALLAHAEREAGAGERFLEFRLDFLNDAARGPDVVRQFLRANPDCRVLATCRRHQNHGRFNGSVEEQLRILTAAVEAGAQAVDVEVETGESAASKLHVFEGRAVLVLSYHNYEGTPALDALARRMLRVPADVYKIVTTAKRPSDCQKILALQAAHPKTHFVLLAMGEVGFPTRVLSALNGCAFTYAAPSAAEGTASGQICARQLRQLYRLEKLKRGPKVYGVIADPVRHSISPAVHNRAFQGRRIEAVYLPFLVSPLQLKDFFQTAERLPLAGFSVTIPHKQKVMRYLDSIEAHARRVGAVNTVWRKAGKWRGANTDAAGVRVPLERRLRLAKASVLIAGNGGAARSAAYTLAAAGAQVAITGRNADRVRALARMVDAEALSLEQAEARHFDALVHATPLGMWPHTADCFFRGDIPAEVVFDMVYTPQQTVLLRRAAEAGKRVIPGLEMFLEQAAAQFELWTGEPAPRAVMERAALEALEAQAAQSGNGQRKP